MGNQTSSINKDELKPKSISQVLDYISTYYIVTMDFTSLKKLYDKEYCDKLVILTSDIVQRYFTDMEITYLAQRIKDGVEVNETANDKIIFFDKDQLTKLDIQNSIKKKRICLEIAKFYIKIAHVFAAIVTTINPTYVYKDQEGNTVRANLSEKGNIPVNAPRQIYKLNICDNRINALKNKQTLDPDENGDIIVGPKVCNMNIRDDGETKNLADEPGIPELMELYYDDNYDLKSGTFTGMTEKTKKTFQEDLKIFYNVFTGNANLPPEITKFSDIKLRDFHKLPKCQGDNPIFDTKYKGKLSDKLFSKYADNLKKMVQTTNKNQEALLTIINQIFVYTVDPQTGKKQIRVSPKLTVERLQEIVVETRALIIKLYLTCEVDYVNGLKLYEAIVEQKILDTAQNQINSLEKLSDKIITEEQIPQPAELKEIKAIADEKIEEKKEEANKLLENIQKDEQIVQQNPAEVLIDKRVQPPAVPMQQPAAPMQPPAVPMQPPTVPMQPPTVPMQSPAV
jgi:hypothetical protein